jgi:DNA primase
MTASRASREELEEQLDLEYWFDRESIAHRIGRGSSGMQINCKECPSCGDSRWRTYLNLDTGLGNCFVCNEGYSKLKFIHLSLGHDRDNRQHWGLTFKHVQDCLVEQGWRPKRTMEVAVEYEKAVFPESLALPLKDGSNLNYLLNRGITNEITKYFHLRYCQTGKWWFTAEDGERRYQKFDERVIIPIYDLDGTFKTFQGRDLSGISDKKYLFPKGLPGTGRYLLNGQSVQRAKRACLGEGGFDVFAMKMAFDEEVALRDVVPIGSFGKHLSYGSIDRDDQLSRFRTLMEQGLEEVVIMWDGEHKALLAACEAAKLLRQLGLRVRIALLPKDRDPNEVTRDVVRKAFWEAVPYTPQQHIKWMLKSPF